MTTEHSIAAHWHGGFEEAALQAWAAWCHEVSRIPYSVSDASVGERKLAWWAQAVSNGFSQAPQHPLLPRPHANAVAHRTIHATVSRNKRSLPYK